MAFAYQGNYGTSPNASTFSSDIASATRAATSSDSWREYLTEQIFLNSAFVQSGIMTRSSILDQVGSRVEVPFFDPLNFTEENINSSATWGTNSAGYLTSQKQTASTQYATRTTRGAEFAADSLSSYDTGEDTLANITSQLQRDINRKQSTKLISMLTGQFGPSGPMAATNAVNKSVTSSAAEANYLNMANATEAAFLLGEKANSVTTIAVHSDVAAYLRQAGMLQFSSTALAASGAITWGGGGIGVGPSGVQIGQAFGFNIIVDDQMPIRGTSGQAKQFVCYMFAPGTVLTGSRFPMEINSGYNMSSFQNIMSVRYDNCMHVNGLSWGNAADYPANSALATAGNWSLAFSEPRNIPIVELTVNSPYGGNVA